MEVIVHNSEYHIRSHVRYVFFAGGFGALIVLSILYDNVIGAVVLLFLLGGYMFFTVSNTQPISLRVDQQYLQVGKKSYPWAQVNGFMIEVAQPANEIKNLILILEGRNYIHTFKDTPTKVRNFIVALSEQTTMLSEVKWTTAEKVTRGLKL